MRPEAVEAMLPFLADVSANPTGGHRAAQRAKAAMEAAREQTAEILGAHPDEIVFTGSGSEGDNIAVKGSAWAARAAGRGDGVVVAAFEHKAVLAAADRLDQDGFRVTRVGVTPGGIIDLDALADALDDRTAVVSTMLVNNEVGTRQPLAAISELVATMAPRAALHTDAIQAPQWLDVAAETAGVGLVATSGHKFGGPKGTGALVVRDGVDLVPLVEGGGHEWGVRAGTQNVAGIVAFATALAVTHERRDDERARIGALRDRLQRELLDRVPGAVVNGEISARVEGSLHIAFTGIESESLLVALDRRDIYAAAGSSCSSGAAEPSYVLSAMGMERDRQIGSIRLSLGYASTDADIDAAVEVIPEAVAALARARALT